MKKIYNCSGFDCAHCAAKTEEHLSKHPDINSVRLDFAANKLYLDFKKRELSIDEIKRIIAEVESEPIEVSENSSKMEKTKIFDKDFFLLLGRVLFGVVTIILNFTIFSFEKDAKMHTYTNFWVNFALYGLSIIILTYDIVWKVIKHIIHKENPIDEYLLITLSAFGAYLIAAISSGDFMESVMVVALFQVGRIFEGVATNKSKEAIMAAVDLRVSYANKIENDKLIQVEPEELKIGDVVVVNVGEMIPTDGKIIAGEALIDTSSLTGEFVPLEVTENDEVFSGCLIKNGTIKIKVTKEYKDSTISRIIELVTSSGERKSKADKFITKFARIYTPTVFVVSTLFALIGGLITGEWALFVLTGLKMLVIACPCAVVISIPMAYFSAIGLASKNGIVIKGTAFFDELNRMKKVVTDKTGTLTEGSFKITKIEAKDVSEEELLEVLYAAESLSKHPIAKAITHGIDISKYSIEEETYEEIVGEGIKCVYQGKSIGAGNMKLMKRLGIVESLEDKPGTVIYVAKDGKYLGCVTLSDTIKEEARTMVSLFHKEKMEIVLLTGDKEKNALEVGKELNLDATYSSLLPNEKTELLEKELSKEYSLAYLGDGINDAASIRLADIGVAMGGIGSDVAVENADIIIMNDDPSKLYDAYKIAKFAHRKAKFNLVAALGIKLSIELVAIIFTLLNYFSLSSFSLPMWAAVLADTGLTVLLVLNSLTVLYKKVRK